MKECNKGHFLAGNDLDSRYLWHLRACDNLPLVEPSHHYLIGKVRGRNDLL